MAQDSRMYSYTLIGGLVVALATVRLYAMGIYAEYSPLPGQETAVWLIVNTLEVIFCSYEHLSVCLSVCPLAV